MAPREGGGAAHSPPTFRRAREQNRTTPERLKTHEVANFFDVLNRIFRIRFCFSSYCLSWGAAFLIGRTFTPSEILLKYAPVALRSPRGGCEGTYLQVVL